MKIYKAQRFCPKCNKFYSRYPATSRKDGKTLICPDCGIREALASINVHGDEADRIVQIVNDYYARGGRDDD